MIPPLHEQIVVITGASSGIGRATAHAFAKSGATVVIAARNEVALHDVAQAIMGAGGRAQVVATDVADWQQVERLARETMNAFGRIDTWVNAAAGVVYATVEDTSIEEAERVLQVDLLGTIYGVKAALEQMKHQGRGTIINIGSVASIRALPYLSAYCAAKHGVKGFSESLRMELAREHPNIHVTLVLPSGVNTPFFNHARSKLGVKPMPIPPAYSPELVADAIVSAAERPRRDIYIGGPGFLLAVGERLSPALMDRVSLWGNALFRLQKSNEPDDGVDNLFQPMSETGRVHGDFPELTKPSMFTPVFELMPTWQRLSLATFAAGVVAALALRRR